MKKSKLYTILALCVAFIASIALTAVTAFAEDVVIELAGWGGVNEKSWTNERLDDGSVHVMQGELNENARYNNPTSLELDGLVLNVTFKTPGAIALGNNEWATYATNSALIIRLDKDLYSPTTRATISVNCTGGTSTTVLYENANDAISPEGEDKETRLKRAGTHIDGAGSAVLLLDGDYAEELNVSLRVSFKKYSTKRYLVTFTCSDFYKGMGGKQGDSISYYINTDDFGNLFVEDNTYTYVKLVALGNNTAGVNKASELADMTIKACKGEKGQNIIEDDKFVDKILESMINDEIVPAEGKKVLKITEEDMYDKAGGYTPDSVVYENGVVAVSDLNAGWGSRSGMKKALPLDGLRLTAYFSEFTPQKYVGFVLGENFEGFYQSGGLTIMYQKDRWGTNQPRLYIARSHAVDNINNPNEVETTNPSYMYKTLEDAQAMNRNTDKNSKNTIDCIVFDGPDPKLTFDFEKQDENVYKITITIVNTEDVKFNGTTIFNGKTAAEVYVNLSEIKNVADGGAAEGPHIFNKYGFTYLSCVTAFMNANAVCAYSVEVPEGYVDSCEIELEHEEYVYAGEPIEAKVVSVKSGEHVFTEDDYEVTYLNTNSIGNATVVITFKGQYIGCFTKEYKIIGRDASAAVITLEYTSVVYTTMENRPKIVSVMLGEESIASTNYYYVYANNVDPGIATVTLNFINDYSGTASTTFEITKIQKNTEGEHVELSGDVAYADLLTLGGDYTYTVTDSEGNVVEEGAKLKGDYTVKAVKESKTTVETVTYTVTVIGSQKVDCRSCKSSMGTCGIISLIALGFAAIKRRKI